MNATHTFFRCGDYVDFAGFRINSLSSVVLKDMKLMERAYVIKLL